MKKAKSLSISQRKYTLQEVLDPETEKRAARLVFRRARLRNVRASKQMSRTEGEIERIVEWRKSHRLLVDREKWQGDLEFKRPEPKNVHFFNYDPTLGPTDLSNVSVKKDSDRDLAVFSIPQSFTEKARSRYVASDDRSKGFDIQTYLNRHNGPIFPMRR
jgi:hypothetical protein